MRNITPDVSEQTNPYVRPTESSHHAGFSKIRHGRATASPALQQGYTDFGSEALLPNDRGRRHSPDTTLAVTCTSPGCASVSPILGQNSIPPISGRSSVPPMSGRSSVPPESGRSSVPPLSGPMAVMAGRRNIAGLRMPFHSQASPSPAFQTSPADFGLKQSERAPPSLSPEGLDTCSIQQPRSRKTRDRSKEEGHTSPEEVVASTAPKQLRTTELASLKDIERVTRMLKNKRLCGFNQKVIETVRPDSVKFAQPASQPGLGNTVQQAPPEKLANSKSGDTPGPVVPAVKSPSPNTLIAQAETISAEIVETTLPPQTLDALDLDLSQSQGFMSSYENDWQWSSLCDWLESVDTQDTISVLHRKTATTNAKMPIASAKTAEFQGGRELDTRSAAKAYANRGLSVLLPSVGGQTQSSEVPSVSAPVQASKLRQMMSTKRK